MLITIEDYKKITGKTLADEELAKVETLLKSVVRHIENILGYELEEHEIVEFYPYMKNIYLNHRPVVKVTNVFISGESNKEMRNFRYGKSSNFITLIKYRECPCCYKQEKEVEITYTAGYKELPDWLKFEIVGLVDDFINSFDEEISKYTSYKIDDIAYSMRDMLTTRNDKLNNIARLIYG